MREPVDYTNPKHRLPGSGGGNGVMSFCDRTIIVLRQDRRRFPEKVDPDRIRVGGKRAMLKKTD